MRNNKDTLERDSINLYSGIGIEPEDGYDEDMLEQAGKKGLFDSMVWGEDLRAKKRAR